MTLFSTDCKTLQPPTPNTRLDRKHNEQTIATAFYRRYWKMIGSSCTGTVRRLSPSLVENFKFGRQRRHYQHRQDRHQHRRHSNYSSILSGLQLCKGTSASVTVTFQNYHHYHNYRRHYRQQHLLVSTATAPYFSSTFQNYHLVDGNYNIDNEKKQQQQERQGAWTLLAALEKAKEAELIEVARLVTSLETLLPRQQQQEQTPLSSASTAATATTTEQSPLFTLPPTKVVTGNDVVSLLQATRRGHLIHVQTVKSLIEGATLLNRYRRRDRLVQLPPLREGQQIQIVGDLHGSLSDLATVLALMPDGEPTKNNQILFNGDLADRGENGIEVICMVCCLSMAYPDYVYVNRGNHEDIALSIAYGLAQEITKKYGANVRRYLRPTLDAYFRSLPLATVIEKDAMIVHAGPPPPTYDNPDTKLVDILVHTTSVLTGSGLSRTVVDTSGVTTTNEDNDNDKIGREIIEALLWSDPIVDECAKKLYDYGSNSSNEDEDQMANNNNNNTTNDTIRINRNPGWIPNESRGAGWKFDATVVRNFLKQEGLSRFIRSHEPVRQGCVRYEIDQNQDSDTELSPMELFTVFSASRYPYKEGFNQGAVLELKSNGKHDVLRYETEDDEPIKADIGIDAVKSFDSLSDFLTPQNKKTENAITSGGDEEEAACSINLNAVRRSLTGAIAYNRIPIYEQLNNLLSTGHDTVPFDTLLDILIKALKLDNEYGLKKRGARTVIAKALEIECHETHLAPTNVNLKELIGIIAVDRENIDKKKSTCVESYAWLFSVFEAIDINQDGFIRKNEWYSTIKTINSKLREGYEIDPNKTWSILDSNGDGKVSMTEWEKLGYAMNSREILTNKYDN